MQWYFYVMLDPINKHRIEDEFDHNKQMPEDSFLPALSLLPDNQNLFTNAVRASWNVNNVL